MGEAQFLVDDSAAGELAERITKLVAAARRSDDIGFVSARAQLLAWLRSTGRFSPMVPGLPEPSGIYLPSEKENTLYDSSPAFAAVAIYRKLAATDPDRYRPGLAASLDNLGAQLFALGRPDDALPVTQSSVEGYCGPLPLMSLGAHIALEAVKSLIAFEASPRGRCGTS